MFEMELIICIKMYLALNNLQMLIRHKTQTTNQPLHHYLNWFKIHLKDKISLINWLIVKPLGDILHLEIK